MPAIREFVKSLQIQRRWAFLAFLVALHLVLLQGPTTSLGRLMFLSHIGLGLLWQPFVQPRRRLGFSAMVVVVVFAGLFAYSLNWGLLALWGMLLTGVVGGKVFLFPDRWERIFHLMGLGYLATAVLALILPQTLMVLQITEPVVIDLARYVMPGVFLFMAFIPLGQAETERAEIVDYIYGVFVFLLLAVIVLGSVSMALVFSLSYFESLLVSLSLTAGVLLLLGWIWNPHSGFGGLGGALAQHVLSLGLPIEEWLQSLAELAKNEDDPERFLAKACAEIPRRLPGIVGGDCTDSMQQHRFGEQQGYLTRFRYGHLQLDLRCRVEVSPSLLWHYDLIARLLAEFHLGKWRERELRRLTYVEAIHATGARLTHDVKNLLQSLETLCAAMQSESVTPSPRFVELMRRQLPVITARLGQTLGKLSAPAKSLTGEPVRAGAWFAALADRYVDQQVEFECASGVEDILLVAGEMFSSVAENLLQNLLAKQHNTAGLHGVCRLGLSGGQVWLEVADTGEAIPPELARILFLQPVTSESGLGIGLYQSALLAAQYGYRLWLAENRPGYVLFRLAAVAESSADA
jgi:signal transduction histidine kinase